MFDRKPLLELEEALASGGRRPRAPAHPPLGAALASPFLPGDAYEDAESYPGWFIGGLFLVMSVALAITVALPTDWLPAVLDALPGGSWVASAILGAVIGVCGSVPMYFACGAATTVGLRLAGFADASWVLGRHLGTLTMLPYAALSFVGWVVLASRWPTPAEAFAGMSWEPVFGLVGLVWSSGLLVYAAVVTYELRWWRATLILAVVPVGLTLGGTVWSLGGPGVGRGFGGRGAATTDIRDLRAVAPMPAKASDSLTPTRPQRVTVGPLALRAPAGWRAEPLDRPTLRIDDEAGRAALATAKAPWSNRSAARASTSTSGPSPARPQRRSLTPASRCWARWSRLRSRPRARRSRPRTTRTRGSGTPPGPQKRRTRGHAAHDTAPARAGR
jgi:hypothetical protein